MINYSSVSSTSRYCKYHSHSFSQMERPPRPTLFDFHGVSMTKYFTDNWDNIQSFKARPDDILIATYPKAGGVVRVRLWNLWHHSHTFNSFKSLHVNECPVLIRFLCSGHRVE